MAISASDVKALREATGAGMMDCKKALTEADGNIEKATEILREKGLAAAAKKSGRIAAEGVVASYIHMGGRIGVLVNMDVEGIDPEKVTEMGKDLCMQVAAMNPSFCDKSDVDQTTLDKEKEIQLALAMNENEKAAKPKPQNIIEKMVMGRISKYYEENCLMQMAFVKDGKMSVEDYVAATAKELGGKIKVNSFVRFEKGEGIEKRQDNLAEEVANRIK